MKPSRALGSAADRCCAGTRLRPVTNSSVPVGGLVRVRGCRVRVVVAEFRFTGSRSGAVAPPPRPTAPKRTGRSAALAAGWRSVAAALQSPVLAPVDRYPGRHLTNVTPAHSIQSPTRTNQSVTTRWSDNDFDFRAAYLVEVDFTKAVFRGSADFDEATFSGWTGFDSVTFNGRADFDSATFNGYACFHSATFSGYAGFDSATFNDWADFESATFNWARFDSATFSGRADFEYATFSDLDSAHFVPRETSFRNVRWNGRNPPAFDWLVDSAKQQPPNVVPNPLVFTSKTPE